MYLAAIYIPTIAILSAFRPIDNLIAAPLSADGVCRNEAEGRSQGIGPKVTSERDIFALMVAVIVDLVKGLAENVDQIIHF
jgi:hypothetical protein